ncbi:MAG TPA: hypothetical protein DD424_05725 [Porphyromonadaceae bacterium]|nr:hypothetical protein [Porphyromonadaceae bacterium]
MVFKQAKTRIVVLITIFSDNPQFRKTGNIAERLVGAARELLNDLTLSVTQIGDRLGFEYPQHFVRFFKRRTGRTPKEYRALSSN